MELTILMPCLNEERTIAYCIEEASSFLRERGIPGEILIADNGSTDHSIEIAKEKGVRVIGVTEKGYGAALRKDMRGGSSHLRTIRDGLRHLKYIILN